jgi:hypothetical protein
MSRDAQFTRFTGTKVQILTRVVYSRLGVSLLYAAHLSWCRSLYWYKSTVLGAVQRLTTHGCVCVCVYATLRISAGVARELLQGTPLRLRAFYWYKSANTDAGGVARARAS